MESTLKRTWAEIDLDHLTHNFEVIRRRVGDKVKLLGVVKADGYGHGAVEIARRLAWRSILKGSARAISPCRTSTNARSCATAV